MSQLPGSTHPSVKHALLSTPSTSTSFSEEVIRALLILVKDDSQLSLMKNLSSLKGGDKSASASSSSSSSGYRRYDASSLSSPSRDRGFSRPYRDGKRPAYLLHPGIPRSLSKGFCAFLLRKRIFRSRSHVPCLSG